MDVVEYDRRGWQWVKKSNKQSLFKIVDENNDGEITKEEFQKVMDSMNKNNDDRLEAYELQAWILEHLQSICANSHGKIKKLFQQKDAQESVNFQALYDAFDADIDNKINTTKDLGDLFSNMNLDDNDKIDKTEFFDHFETHFYNLELEYALENPKTWKKQKGADLLKQLFPNSTTSIELSEIADFLGKYDQNDDTIISRKEIAL